jgi:aspartate racemase
VIATRVHLEIGCDAVVLGCTEIPLIMNDANSPLPTLDSTRLLARAALRRAVPNSGYTTGMKLVAIEE